MNNMYENAIKEIIAEYKEALKDAGSDWKRQSLMLSTFERILEEVALIEQVEADRKKKKALTDEEREALDESHRLDDNENTLKWKGTH